MQKYLIITLVLLGLLVAIYFMSSSLNNSSSEPEEVIVVATTTETYTMQNEGLMFTYKDGETGFYLEEQEVQGEVSEMKQSITLTPTPDYLDQQDREGGEGSPSWHLAVYNNRFNESLREWIENNSQLSNVHLATNDPSEVMIGGVDGIRYQIDGLYPADVIVFMKDDSVFVVTASYLDRNSQTYLELEPWLNSFTFVPTDRSDVSTSTEGKIDVKVACESALIYMTFMSGDDADRFVTECIAGEHPEVIERYKADSNIE